MVGTSEIAVASFGPARDGAGRDRPDAFRDVGDRAPGGVWRNQGQLGGNGAGTGGVCHPALASHESRCAGHDGRDNLFVSSSLIFRNITLPQLASDAVSIVSWPSFRNIGGSRKASKPVSSRRDNEKEEFSTYGFDQSSDHSCCSPGRRTQGVGL